MYSLYQSNHIKFYNIIKIDISYQVLQRWQEAQLLLSNVEISLQFIIRLKSFRVGALLSELDNLDHSIGPKYLIRVNRGRLVMKAGELERPNSLLRFFVCHVILKVHTDFQDGGQSIVVLRIARLFSRFCRKSNKNIFQI